MKLLLDRRGKEVKVTEEVVRTAALNKSSGEQVMKLLLTRRDEEVKVTEEVVRAATQNKSSGEQVMRLLLLNQRVKFTNGAIEEVVRAAESNWSKTIRPLLFYRQVKF
ncbi:ankyrin repeat and sam domain containing protein 6 [Colletotrichum asianum]|uniref:Ankyrin repeat and sam domain containing protein 6 n=1 Tax=Colletotrichum asianum TaxID=702518 RepID=A0A8H3VWG3_9PEZI|nr:ankyrin repeat and sam domain containing protein 6 [Colletotrichum asianum]